MSTSPAPISAPSAHRAAGDRPFPKPAIHHEWTVFRTLATWMMRSAQRRALRELPKEDRLLADIGLTREQVLREASKPFWRS